MKIIMCLHMLYCLWGLWYVSTMVPIDSIPNAAASIAVCGATIAYVDQVFHEWFK